MINLLTEEKIKNYVLVSPDYGSYQRVKKLSEYLNVNTAIMNKKRPLPNETKVNFLLGNVAHKNLIIIDDMIDTGNTIVNSLEYLRKKQAKDMYIVATHPVFSDNALEKLHNFYKKG
jgi:ribose-phosphate pyrophosphokinase